VQYPTRANFSPASEQRHNRRREKGITLKRIIAIAGVVLGLGAIGLTAAHAASSGPSTWCTNGDGTETNVPNPYVGLSYDHWQNWYGWELYTACWSTTPAGSTAPEAAGGNFRAGYREDSPYDSTLALWCEGDRTADTMATVDCANYVSTTDDHNTSTAGRSASGAFSFGAAGPLGFGRTGIDVASPATSTTTSGSTPGLLAGTGGGTCTWVNGTSPYCPSGANVAGVNVATGDVSANPVTNPGGCVTAFGNPCYLTAPSGAGVQVAKGDASNDTVSTTVLGTPVSTDLGDCYGYNMPSGTC
jgi:hypothetical protein